MRFILQENSFKKHDNTTFGPEGGDSSGMLAGQMNWLLISRAVHHKTMRNLQNCSLFYISRTRFTFQGQVSYHTTVVCSQFPVPASSANPSATKIVVNLPLLD
ncbi:hypothetical protein Y032_0102g3472 [Ancylostoma ceylanicum]|uniref:Uncharacterized protein n=1 Tax=Ancylostoma ceylanicum TaxID=53326 RepID=A0A016THH2_9BILA|nr:hypothetical protein Y032_0102g3472 [Ancylostoma ceylanicum]